MRRTFNRPVVTSFAAGCTVRRAAPSCLRLTLASSRSLQSTPAAMPTQEVVQNLNNLIETAKDSAEGFKTAAENVKSPSTKQKFEDYSDQRQHFCKDLQERVKGLGGTPETTSSTLGAIHRGWVNLKSALTLGDRAIVIEVIRGEEVAERNYAAVAQNPAFPSDLKGEVKDQHHKIQESLNYARDLDEKLKEGSGEKEFA